MLCVPPRGAKPAAAVLQRLEVQTALLQLERDSTGNLIWKGLLWTQKCHFNFQESITNWFYLPLLFLLLKCLKHYLNYFYKRKKKAPIQKYFKNRGKYWMAEGDNKILPTWNISLYFFISYLKEIKIYYNSVIQSSLHWARRDQIHCLFLAGSYFCFLFHLHQIFASYSLHNR